MFHPGETVTQRFTIPFVASTLSQVIVTYKQGDHLVLVKTITSNFEDVDGKTRITVVLTQAESLLFNDKMKFTIQLNVFTKDGTRATSREIRSENAIQHYKGVMPNGV